MEIQSIIDMAMGAIKEYGKRLFDREVRERV